MPTPEEQAQLDAFAGQIVGRRADGSDRLGDLWNEIGAVQAQVTEIRDRIHDPVKGYDNFQDILNLRFPSVEANLKTLETKLQTIVTKLVRASIEEDPTGAIYAVNHDRLTHITDGDTFNAGTAVGLWGGWEDIVTIPFKQLQLLAAFLGGNLYVVHPPIATPATSAH